MSKATDKQWRVQVRKSRAHKWVKLGLYETRERARFWSSVKRHSFGFGNTRVIPYVKAVK